VWRFLGSLLAPDAAEQDAAWQRAESLLKDSLPADQYEAYRTRGFVDVPSTKFAERTYRVDGWRPVGVYERGQFVGAVCIRPRVNMPGPDVVLARKLMIEGAEDEFLHAGNWLSPAWRPAGVTPTIFLLVVLISPWLLQLRQLGAGGLALGIALICLPAVSLLWRRRRRTNQGLRST
jgi:hypothetical protein